MTWRLISELQFCRSRASIRGDLIPFSSILDVGLYRNRTQPLDDERIIGRSERQRRFRAAGVGSAFEQRPRCGEVAILEKSMAALDQGADLLVVERCGRFSQTLLDSGGNRRARLRDGRGWHRDVSLAGGASRGGGCGSGA